MVAGNNEPPAFQGIETTLYLLLEVLEVIRVTMPRPLSRALRQKPD